MAAVLICLILEGGADVRRWWRGAVIVLVVLTGQLMIVGEQFGRVGPTLSSFSPARPIWVIKSGSSPGIAHTAQEKLVDSIGVPSWLLLAVGAGMNRFGVEDMTTTGWGMVGCVRLGGGRERRILPC